MVRNGRDHRFLPREVTDESTLGPEGRLLTPLYASYAEWGMVESTRMGETGGVARAGQVRGTARRDGAWSSRVRRTHSGAPKR